MACNFVIDLLRHLVVSSEYNSKRFKRQNIFNLIETLNHGHQYVAKLESRYSSHYIIIKYIGFEPIFYAINMDIMSSSKVFNKFDYMLLLNVLLV